MTTPSRCFTLALALFSNSIGGTASFENFEKQDNRLQAFVPAFDILTTTYEVQDGLEFDDSDAELDASRFTMVALLSRPVDLGARWNFLPAIDYSLTSLDLGATPAGFPANDEELHKVGLHATFFRSPGDSRWLYGGWGRANFASDTQHIDGDDFYFDAALFGGYIVTERLLLGLGVVGLELGSDSRFLAGPGFYWKPSDALDVSLMGALFNTTWRPCDDWVIALRMRPFGNNWNIDNNGVSQQLDLSAYTVRLHAERRIYRDMWLSLGLGYAFGGELELRDSADDRLFKDDLDGGLSSSIGLRIRKW